MLNSAHASSLVPSSREPDILGDARESKVFPGQTTLSPNIPVDEEGKLHNYIDSTNTVPHSLLEMIPCAKE